MQELSFNAPPALAVAENATSPTGLLGAEIWSTTASKKLVWDGSKWASASGVNDMTPIQAMLTSTQANSSNTTPSTLTDHSWTIQAGKALSLDSILIATAAATTTGICHGGQIVVPSGVSGTVRCAWFAYTNLSSAAAATGLSDGDVLNRTTSGTTEFLNIGTATVAGNNSSYLKVLLYNNTNVDVTFSVRLRSEVNGSAVTAQAGTAANGFIFTP